MFSSECLTTCLIGIVLLLSCFFIIFSGIPDKYFFLLWFLHESVRYKIATYLQHARCVFLYYGLPVFVLFLGFKH